MYQRSGEKINTMGSDIDEIVQFCVSGKASWRFYLLQSINYESKGFPKSLTAFI